MIRYRPHLFADIGLAICVPCFLALVFTWLLPQLLLMLAVMSP